MSLEEYERKRDFSRTPEPPPGASSASKGQRFVVQRHHARRLHYDFRLEAGGVLVSWAIPRGPSMQPTDRRMAVAVEDHPMEYFDFEGNIPPGNYGAGSVMVWDLGTYEVLRDGNFAGQYQKGDIKLSLHGSKLRGEFAMVRTKTATGKDWLLIKKRDTVAQTSWDIEKYAYSALSGRSQAEIAADQSRIWTSGGDSAPDKGESSEVLSTPFVLPPRAVSAPIPTRVTPMLAESAQPFNNPDWLFEIKWDGWRALTYLAEGGTLRLLSRTGKDLLHQFPELGKVRSQLRADSCILDGEIVALDDEGISQFSLLQRRLKASGPRARSGPVTYYLFDLLYWNGWDLRPSPLEERKRLLSDILSTDDTFRISDHVLEEGQRLYQLAEARGIEGVMAKQRRSPYVGARSPSWLKIKVTQTLDCIVVGFTRGKGARSHFGSLVLALYDGGHLVHVGNVGSGFNESLLAEVHADLEGLLTDKCPLATIPKLDDPVRWVRPERVCMVKYGEWSADNILRFPVFERMRPDKAAAECYRGSFTEPTMDKLILRNELLPPGKPDRALTVDSMSLKFTNLDKVYFPADGITKRDVINYYNSASDFVLPHLRDRALTLKRYPEGITGEFFFQRHGDKFPEWVSRVTIIDDEDKEKLAVICPDRATLLFLANLGCIDQNPQQSRLQSPQQPDWMLLDLDPQQCSYDKIVEVALVLRGLLEKLGLHGYPKTTGSRGLHIYVPVARGCTFEQTALMAQLLARVAASTHPNLITLARLVSRREKNRVYIDYPQAGRGRSISAPYCIRPHAGATVATPLEWSEVKPGLHPSQFNIRTVLDRFAKKGDLFAPVLAGGQDLLAAIPLVDTLMES